MPGFTVTRGLGSRSSPSSLIFRGMVARTIEVIRKVIRRVGNGAKRIAEIIPEMYRVRAMLLAVNSEEIITPTSKLLVTEVYEDHESTVTVSDIATTSIKSTPYRIVISDVKVKKGDS